MPNDIREGILRRNCCSFGFCPKYLRPPHLNLDNLYNFFSDVEIQDLKVNLGLKILFILYLLYMLYIQPKTQFKVQIISILEEVDSLIDQNCTSCAKKIGQGPSPPRPHLDKLQKKAFFSQENVL